jgi:hypothetical protein
LTKKNNQSAGDVTNGRKSAEVGKIDDIKSVIYIVGNPVPS